jgi:hypothetical protein
MEQERSKQDQGLGDTIARITAVTRIDRLATRIAQAVGEKDCGCAQRRQLLNEMFPYKRAALKAENKITQ